MEGVPSESVSGGYVKTATEVSSDTSALMRNMRKNENALQGALMDVSKAVMACSGFMGASLPNEGEMSVIYDDSIVQGTASEKQQDMAEVAVGLMSVAEYRARWHGNSAGGSGAAEGSRAR